MSLEACMQNGSKYYSRNRIWSPMPWSIDCRFNQLHYLVSSNFKNIQSS